MPHQTAPFNLNYDLIEAIYEVKECRIKLPVLRNVIWHLLYDWGVDCRFGCNVAIDDDTFSGYDKVILCTYGSESCTKTLKRFELIEKPVVALNTTGEWYNNSLVVMDGPFFSCDPLLGTPYHLLGHVKHCIHGAYDSTMAPDFEESSAADAAMYIDKGCIPAELLGPVSNFDAFQEDIGRFIPDMEFHLGHIGSFFTIRTVLSGVDSTDERPTIVTPIDDKYINVFSGKIGNCIDAAEEVVELCSQ